MRLRDMSDEEYQWWSDLVHIHHAHPVVLEMAIYAPLFQVAARPNRTALVPLRFWN